MADEHTARRDAWRKAQTATTVTGKSARELAVEREAFVQAEIERYTNQQEATDGTD